MNRAILTRLVGERHMKKLSYRRFCDKRDEPPVKSEASNETVKQEISKNEPEISPLKKIDILLKQMLVESNQVPKAAKNEFTKPPGMFHRPAKVEEENIEQKIAKAAIEVAESFGADAKQTETELLSKVLGKISPLPEQVNWNDLIVGMKVDRSGGVDDDFKKDQGAQNLRDLLARGQSDYQRRQSGPAAKDVPFKKRTYRPQPQSSDNIFKSSPLGIFKKSPEVNYGTKLDVWDSQFEKDLQLSVQRSPENYFEKMILWTNEGKIWKFPINNEQGLDEEAKVHFTEHVFMEQYLEGWCPDSGPIRHFMELVCVGLSKNPYYSVQDKKDHINWFRDYFKEREALLKEVGAIPQDKSRTSETSTAA